MILFGSLLLEELVQVLVNMVGLCLAVAAATEAGMDGEAARYEGHNGARRLKARGNVRDEGIKVLLHLIFLFDALLVAASPNPEAPYEAFSARMSVWSIILVSATMTIGSGFTLWDRRRLWELTYRLVGKPSPEADEVPADGAG